MERKYRTCNLCEAMCGLAISVDQGRISEVRADPEDVFSRGHLCPKAFGLKEIHEDPDRLRRPLRRTSHGWEPVGWEAAFEEAADRLGDIRSRHGKDALGLYLGNPVVHGHGIALLAQGFARTLGTRNRFDANSQDANPKLFVCMLMYGDQLSITLPDVDRTDYLLMLGANPAASNGSLMTLGDVRGRLTDIRARGGRIVLLDPRRTETAAWCDEHHFVRPGADAALLLALLHVLFAESLCHRGALLAGTRGLATLEPIARRFAPERVSAAVGVPAEVMRRIARELAAARRAVVYGRVGICQNSFGALASWLVEAINVVTGNFDRPGGAMFATPAVDLAPVGRKLIGNHWARWRSRVRGLPEFGGQLPAAVMAEEMETPGRGQIRGFVTIAGNPVLSTPDGERLARALAGLEYMVSIDCYLNETTRHAHLVLPPVHSLERSHYDVIFHALAVRNTAKYCEPVLPAPADGREDWEILYELGMRMGGLRFGQPVLDRLARLAWRGGLRLSPDRAIDLLLRLGPYGDRFGLRRGLSLAKLRRVPHGVDLGPLQPVRARRVLHADGRVDLAPEPLLGDVPRLERWLDDHPNGSLVLIGRRHLRTNNSWMHNCRSLAKGPNRATVLLHPSDAERLGIATGALVRVESRVGAVTARAERSVDIMPGVISLPHGYGHASARATLRVAGALDGPNINALTDQALVEPLTGTAVLNGVPVTVAPVAADDDSL
jgi:anaerobic selenocysteine-containing dehydrogenase